MNWDDPAERFRLIERVGHEEYNRLLAQHHKDSVIENINGHEIRPVASRFGRLFMVGDTGSAFSTIEGAREFARQNPNTAVFDDAAFKRKSHEIRKPENAPAKQRSKRPAYGKANR